MHVGSHASLVIRNVLAPAMDCEFSQHDISPLISTIGINHGLDHAKCVKVLVRRSSPVRKLASTIYIYTFSIRTRT